MGRHFIIQLRNHPGELAHLARAMAARGIELHGVSCVGHGPLACMVTHTSDDQAAREVLHGLGHAYIEGEPVFVDVSDRAGGLAEVSERLAAAGVNITGILESGRRPGVIEMAFCVDDEHRAREAVADLERDRESVREREPEPAGAGR
jgi:hypothetical protein